MRTHPQRLLVSLLLAGLVAACAGNAPATSTPTGDRNVITQQQIADNHFQNAYEAVDALHPIWLQMRGTTSTPNPVWVYMDNNKLGDVETLKNVQAATILSIRHYNANEAIARWGVGHASGVVYVTTSPSGTATPGTPPATR